MPWQACALRHIPLQPMAWGHEERPIDGQPRQRADTSERCVHDGKRAEESDEGRLKVDCSALAR